MAYKYVKNENRETEILIDGFEKGIAPSPHKGFANMQGVNISTENGEAMCSFSRIKQLSSTTTGGTVAPNNSTSLHFTITTGSIIQAGMWVQISANSITGLGNNIYYIDFVQSVGGVITVTLITPGNSGKSYVGAAVTGLGATGTANFTIINTIGTPVASATEQYFDSSNNAQYRYYIMDNAGLVFVYDTALVTANFNWFLPCSATITVLSNGAITTASGLAVLNGWLAILGGSNIYWRSTSLLGSTPSQVYSAALLSNSASKNPHTAFVGHQGKMYYCDGSYIGSIFPNTSLVTGVTNIQSYAQYTAVTTTGTIASIFNGSTPSLGTGSTVRIPALFFTGEGGTQPTNLTAGTVYYIQYATTGASTFDVYAASSGGVAIDIASGAAGTQFFNTFAPIYTNGFTLITFTPQRLVLPSFEIAQSIAEIGNTVIIGGKTNVLYPWNQVDALPGDLIFLPENNVVNMITVNNMAYVFAGQKGNIYITNGANASLTLTVPDYCAGIAGTPSTYIEPYFTWGGAMYTRGRVWFSILDQRTGKAGNCGGIWSFIPSQNMALSDDGTALRLENQSSYGTYSGVCPVLLPSQNQSAIAPQYWSAWYSSITSAVNGIDFTDTGANTQAIIETDLIPTGTNLIKQTFKQVEYKVSAPLSGETIGISYRINSTDAYISLGTAITDSTLSGYFPVNFQKTEWLQLKVTLNPAGSSSSFVRLNQIRIR